MTNQTYRIMAIDDDVSLLRTIESILLEENYTVSIAKSGKQALTLLNNGIIPDIILLDISMPDMDGYSTFKEIKTKYNNIPIIFLTGMDGMQAELDGLELGAVDFITKPFVKNILLARIKTHLHNSKSYQQATAPNDNLAVSFDDSKLEKMKNTLTEAEFKVGKLIALGYTNQEIADELAYSYSYVKKIAYRIFDKLEISKRNEIRAFFVKQ